MRKAKFWVMQIIMVAIVGLVFGSPVLAGPPDHAKGVEMKNLKADGNAKDNANDNAGFENTTPAAGSGTVVVEEPTGCAEGQLDLYGDGTVCL